jgi:hypothetical protein
MACRLQGCHVRGWQVHILGDNRRLVWDRLSYGSRAHCCFDMVKGEAGGTKYGSCHIGGSLSILLFYN